MKKFVSILLLSACSCEEDAISKFCLEEKQCVVQNGKTIIVNWLNKPSGQCTIGKTKCDERGNVVFCEGYVGPTIEVCDGIDNDCNGIIDNGFDKDNDGFTTCAGDCNDKNPSINPGAIEICNNVDDNCDGRIDENVAKECWSQQYSVVFNDKSICKKGIQTCHKGYWGACEGQITPKKELCDGLDNDCDGEIDEKEYQNCGPDILSGQCRKGDSICVDGDSICINATHPTAEICDGIDNDCDGTIDNGLYRLCETLCGRGIETCVTGNWTNCTALKPTEEICDGFDNDCDGTIDEGCSCITGQVSPCISNIIDKITNFQVFCGFGIQLCTNGSWGECYYYGTTDEICNAWDDDCDGKIDGLVETCGSLRPELSGVGVCQTGFKSCSLGAWSDCKGEVLPLEEICDGLDNDCDGEIDEELKPKDKVDIVFAIDDSGSMCGIVQALTAGILAYASDFIDTDHQFGLVTFPSQNWLPGVQNIQPFDVKTIPPLTNVINFQSSLLTVLCESGGSEPSYDVAYLLTSAATNFPWRSDAYPYLIIVTDEPAQTWTGLGIRESWISFNTTNCSIGGCSQGDKIEVFVITTPQFFYQWDEIVYFDNDRLLRIFPASAQRYVDMLRKVFSNICI